MISPHGKDLVNQRLDANRTQSVKDEIKDQPTVTLDQNLLFDFWNLAHGVYSPLKGFLTQNDLLKVVNDITLESGVVWPLPIVLDVPTEFAETIEPGERIGLTGPDGTVVGAMDVEEIYRFDPEAICEPLFGTADDDHPGVRMLHSKDPFFIAGPIYAFEDTYKREGVHHFSPKETRVLFNQYDWDSVVGFQTRNAPHRAHEYLQKSALEHIDGLYIQPKIGEKKTGDYLTSAILSGYETLIDNYYPSETTILSMFTSRMWYAGPREAIFDAIVRKNYGCTHFIIGRDHAGVGDYYGEFEAQELLKQLGDIGIKPLYYQYAFYCTRCDGIVSQKICPHSAENRMEPSGTKLRSALSDGKKPPSELMRPEVAETILSLDHIFVGDN